MELYRDVVRGPDGTTRCDQWNFPAWQSSVFLWKTYNFDNKHVVSMCIYNININTYIYIYVSLSGLFRFIQMFDSPPPKTQNFRFLSGEL